MNCKTTPEIITALQPNEIFVFGSNLNGYHGGGAARAAMAWGAIYEQGEGMQGSTYAFPTLGKDMDQLSLSEMAFYCQNLFDTIRSLPHLHFLITKVGCGIAGFSIEEIAPLFKDFIHLSNCSLPIEFIDIIHS